MTPDPWDPGQYERFRSALTRQLHDRLGARTTLGVDTSEAMLARCAEHAGGGLSFVQGDLAEPAGWATEGDFDLVFSNAARHWVEDHHASLRVYLHELPDRDAVLEWMWGTTLTDSQRRTPAGLFDE